MEIVTINYGKALPERERVSGKIPVYSSAGVTGWHNQYLVNSRGIVIGRKRVLLVQFIGYLSHFIVLIQLTILHLRTQNMI